VHGANITRLLLKIYNKPDEVCQGEHNYMYFAICILTLKKGLGSCNLNQPYKGPFKSNRIGNIAKNIQEYRAKLYRHQLIGTRRSDIEEEHMTGSEMQADQDKLSTTHELTYLSRVATQISAIGRQTVDKLNKEPRLRLLSRPSNTPMDSVEHQ
jgi:hypothetical protein